MSLSKSPRPNEGAFDTFNDEASDPSTASRRTLGSPTEASSPPQKRVQVPRACERCKRLRRGCSEYRPCRRCTEAGQGNQCQPAHQPSPATSGGSDSHYQRLAMLVNSRLLDQCIAKFFETLHPTIPILIPTYVTRLRSFAALPDTGLPALCVLSAMCAQVLLQIDEPSKLMQNGEASDENDSFGRLLLDTTANAYRQLDIGAPTTIEACLTAFFLYACEASLCRHSLAFRFLREVATLIVLFRVPDTDQDVKLVARRLFWVVLVSERSHAIRYRRPITLQITSESPHFEMGDEGLVGFWSLASLFRPLDSAFVALHNQETLTISPSAESLNSIENTLNAALGGALDLHDTQKANLRITQLWLRVIIWQLRLRLGYLVEESYQHSSTFGYPVEVAKDLVMSTRDLPIQSFTVHGVGLTEKLFDIASALVDVLARIPYNSATLQKLGLGTLPEDNLWYIRALMRKLPGGSSIYDELLEKHLEQAVPNQER